MTTRVVHVVCRTKRRKQRAADAAAEAGSRRQRRGHVADDDGDRAAAAPSDTPSATSANASWKRSAEWTASASTTSDRRATDEGASPSSRGRRRRTERALTSPLERRRDTLYTYIACCRNKTFLSCYIIAVVVLCFDSANTQQLVWEWRLVKGKTTPVVTKIHNDLGHTHLHPKVKQQMWAANYKYWLNYDSYSIFNTWQRI